MICECCGQRIPQKCQTPGCTNPAVYEMWVSRPPMLVKAAICEEHTEMEAKQRQERQKYVDTKKDS